MSHTSSSTGSSSSTPTTFVGQAMKLGVSAATKELVEGIVVQKVTSKGRWKERVVTISNDRWAILCTHQPIKATSHYATTSKEQPHHGPTTAAAAAAVTTITEPDALYKPTVTNTSSSSLGVVSTVASTLPLPFISRKGIWGLTSNLRDTFVRYIDVADLDYVTTGAVCTRQLEAAMTRKRRQRRGHSQHGDDASPHEIITIGHHGDQSLIVRVRQTRERQQLVLCLQQMMQTYQRFAMSSFSSDSREILLLRYIWYDIDLNRDRRISEAEFIKILSRINFYVKNPQKIFRNFLQQAQPKIRGNGGGLTLSQVLALLHSMKDTEASTGSSRSSAGTRLSMPNRLWNTFFGSDCQVVDAPTFLTFLQTVQGETQRSLSDVTDFLTQINPMTNDTPPLLRHNSKDAANAATSSTRLVQLPRERFDVFLYHTWNDATETPHDDVSSDFSKPLSAYYINTSHNTYLTGDQLQSSSSVEMYARALRRGCKCLELDCWDGDGKVNKKSAANIATMIATLHPVVFHGHTLTSKILFADILQVVKIYLDDHPETYPIILSLENHCSHSFQMVMAQLLINTFGPALYVPNQPLLGELPSPTSLRGKVIIKGKRPPDDDETPETATTIVSEGNDDDDPYDIFGGGVASTTAKAISSEAQAPKKGKCNASGKEVSSSKHPKICKELALLTLFHGTKWRSFDKSINEPHAHMHSISEGKITKILAAAPANVEAWQRYNAHHLTRTYPAGTRVDSSNYDPLVAWSVGCQLVALNFQTTDTPLILNDGLFRQYAGCGYVPKPASVMPLTTATSDSVRNKSSTTVTIRVLSGCCFPKPRGAKTGESIDPYVQVCVHDVVTSHSGTSSSTVHLVKTHDTASVKDNGFCPVWDDKGREFVVHSWDVAMVQFTLKEVDMAIATDDVGYAAIPVRCLRSGYRSIALYDRHNTRTGPFQFATLLVEIQMSETKR